MATVLDVARYFVYLSHSDGEPEPISTKKVQKLLYYAQGTSLAKCGQPLFSDKIKAWCEGPVVPAVWHDLKDHGKYVSMSSNMDRVASLSCDERVLLRQVWKIYGKYTGDALSQKTHNEAPWATAREGLQPDEKSDNEITVESIRDFFLSQNQELPEVAKPVEIRRGREVFAIEDAGKVLPADI